MKNNFLFIGIILVPILVVLSMVSMNFLHKATLNSELQKMSEAINKPIQFTFFRNYSIDPWEELQSGNYTSIINSSINMTEAIINYYENGSIECVFDRTTSLLESCEIGEIEWNEKTNETEFALELHYKEILCNGYPIAKCEVYGN